MSAFVLRTHGGLWLGTDRKGRAQLTSDRASRTKFPTREAAREELARVVRFMTAGLCVAEDESVHSLPDGARKC